MIQLNERTSYTTAMNNEIQKFRVKSYFQILYSVKNTEFHGIVIKITSLLHLWPSPIHKLKNTHRPINHLINTLKYTSYLNKNSINNYTLPCNAIMNFSTVKQIPNCTYPNVIRIKLNKLHYIYFKP